MRMQSCYSQIVQTEALDNYEIKVEFYLMHQVSICSGSIIISLSIFFELQSLTYILYQNICQFIIRSPSQSFLFIRRLLLDLNYKVQLSQRLLLDIQREFVQDTTHFPNSLEAVPLIGGQRPRIYDGYTTCSELKQVYQCNAIREVLSYERKIPKATPKYTAILIIYPIRPNLKPLMLLQHLVIQFQGAAGKDAELALLNGPSKAVQFVYIGKFLRILL